MRACSSSLCWEPPLWCGDEAFLGKVIFRYLWLFHHSLLKRSSPEDWCEPGPACCNAHRVASNAIQMMLLVCQISDLKEPVRAHQALHIPKAGQELIYPLTVNWGVFNRRICEIMITMLAFWVFFVCKIMGFRLNWGRCANVLVNSRQPLSLTSSHKRLW